MENILDPFCNKSDVKPYCRVMYLSPLSIQELILPWLILSNRNLIPKTNDIYIHVALLGELLQFWRRLDE